MAMGRWVGGGWVGEWVGGLGCWVCGSLLGAGVVGWLDGWMGGWLAGWVGGLVIGCVWLAGCEYFGVGV